MITRTSRGIRVLLLAGLVLAGLILVLVGLRGNAQRAVDSMMAMDIALHGDLAFASAADGRLLRLTIDGQRVSSTEAADGLHYPRGLAILDGTLYVTELGPLPCPNPLPRCKGEHVGPTTADGERAIFAQSSGRLLAFPIMAGGELGPPRTVLDGLKFVNADHGLNDLEAGPDGLLYLSVGNVDQLAWDDGGQPLQGPGAESLGTILTIDPDSGQTNVFATGLRNVYGLSFDDEGRLWGVDNDGRGRDVWRAEELLHLQAGLDYGFPDDGTVGPYTRRTGFATWIMPTGAGSSGLHVEAGTVYSGACGRVTRVRLAGDGGDAAERQVSRPGCVTAIERLPDGRFLVATVLGGDPFVVTTEQDLFAR